MSTDSGSRPHVADIGAQIAYAMRAMGVSPIPRNYELYYEAYLGSNPQLTKDLAALGSRAAQGELDALGAQYFAHHHGAGKIDQAHFRLTSTLDALLTLLKEEQQSLESYTRVLGDTYSQINSKNMTSADILRQAIAVLSEATADTIAKRQDRAESADQTSQEMARVRQELDEYKRIANTDSLTRLSNRRAFDDRLAGIFNSEKRRSYTGLLVADIDHFKKINDTFGHPVGDKILATVASIIRANVRPDVFVARTGGEEFAIILDDSTQDECFAVAERIRLAIQETPLKNKRTGTDYGPLTVSLGICMATEAEDPNDLYTMVDIALYSAKTAGRNRSVIYENGMKKESGRNWLLYRK